MFIRDTTKTLFEVMLDFDNCDDPYQRWKELRNGVYYYNEYAGTSHNLTSELINLYWIFCNAINNR